MILVFILMIGISLAFELQKMIQFNYFYKLTCITTDYSKQITNRPTSTAAKEIMKLSLIDMIYSIATIIGLFTQNENLFFTLIFISFIRTILFKFIKIKKIRKSLLIIDAVITIPILFLILSNLIFFKIPDIQLLTNIFEYLKAIYLNLV